MRFLVLLLLVIPALTACAPFPELDAMGPDGATPPSLLPIDEFLAQAGTASKDPGPALAGRAAALRVRAAAIAADTPAP